VAREKGAVYLAKDTLHETAQALSAQAKLPAATQWAGALSYSLLIDLARDNLTLGHSVVLDSPAAYAAFRDEVKALARTHRAELRWIECVCTDATVLRERIERRNQEQPDYRGRNWDAHLGKHEQFERLTERRLVIDTAEALALNLRRVRAYLEPAGSE
jgi:predicted kinase